MATGRPIDPGHVPAPPPGARIGRQLRGLRPRAATALGLVGVVAIAVVVARFAVSGANLVPTLAAVAGLVGLGIAAALGYVRPVVFAGLVGVTFVMPDILANSGAGPAIVVLVAGLAAISLLDVSRVVHQITALDASAFLIFVTGGVMPAIVSGTHSTIVGNAVLILGTYLVARVTAPRWDRLVTVLLLVATIHAVVAIVWAIPATSAMIPFVPLLDGEPNPTSRAVGLFNNPNTFGNLEAMIVVVALWSGVTRRLWPLVLVCIVGILLSGSREALVGLIVASSLLVVRSPVRALAPAGAVGIALGLFLALVPSAQERFDPARYAGDSSLLERFELWNAAVDAIARSPIIGYGQVSGLRAVDQAYLNWLVYGGVLGTAIWVVSLVVLFGAVPARPAVIVMVVVGFLGNPFAGPTLSLLLVLVAASHESPTAGVKRERPTPNVARPSPTGT